MKFIHTADWHFGAPKLLPEYRELAIPKMFSIFRNSKAKFVLVAGDVFDTPEPKQSDKDLLTSFFDTYKDVRIILTPGNHDKAKYVGGPCSINTYSVLRNSLSNVFVCDVGSTVFGDLETTITLLPSDFFKNQDLYAELLNESKKRLSKYNVAVWHGVVPGITFPFSKLNNDTIPKFIDKNHFDYLAIGDIHQQLKLHERCWYPGSLFQKTFSCQDGSLIIDLNGKKITVERIDLGLPKKETVIVSDISSGDTEEAIGDSVLDSVSISSGIVKVILRSNVHVLTEINKRKLNEFLLSKSRLKFILQLDPEQLKTEVAKQEKFTSVRDEVEHVVKSLDIEHKKEVIVRCVEAINNQ